ncbi:MAG TPA: hypothetical protein VIS96_06845 [Terrimicrobiaceae bacterium]
MSDQSESTMQPKAKWIDDFWKFREELEEERAVSRQGEWLLLPQTLDVAESEKGTLGRADAIRFFDGLIRVAEDLEGESPRLDSMPLAGGMTGPRAHIDRQSFHESFGCLRKYDGIIFRRESDTFWARLWEHPLDYPAIEAEFDIGELSESDQLIALEGTPIVWTIGYSDEGGTRKRQSILYVRRIRSASSEEVRQSEQKIRDIVCGIAWE